MGALVLASRSAIRRALLENAGLTLTVDVADVDERALGAATLDAAERARRLASAKALAVARHHPDAIVIGADQVGVLDDGSFLEKPTDPADQVRMLLSMAGRAHTFHRAAALVRAEQVLAVVDEGATVHFRSFGEAAARAYVATGEGAWCCGGYESEHQGAQLIERVDGGLHAVLGLPLFGTLEALRALEPALLL